MKPVDVNDVYEELQQPKYSDIFELIYTPAESPDTSVRYEYHNQYWSMDVLFHEISTGSVRSSESEYVFTCLLRKDNAATADSDDGEDIDGVNSLMDITEEHFDEEEADDVPTETSHSEEDRGEVDFGIDMAEENAGSENVVETEGTRAESPNVGRFDANFHGHPATSNDMMNIHEMIGPMSDIEAVDFYLDDEDDSATEPDRDMTDDDNDPNGIVPFFVSKIYDPHRGLGAHRFVFAEHMNRIMLAEGAAKVSSGPDFNVELHYLELRKHNAPGKKW